MKTGGDVGGSWIFNFYWCYIVAVSKVSKGKVSLKNFLCIMIVQEIKKNL